MLYTYVLRSKSSLGKEVYNQYKRIKQYLNSNKNNQLKKC